MSTIRFTRSSKLLFILGATGGPIGWLIVRGQILGSSSIDVRDFLVGFGATCIVGALLVSAAARRKSS
jgi:hypothetical protein